MLMRNRMFEFRTLAGLSAIPDDESHHCQDQQSRGWSADRRLDVRVLLRLFVLLRCCLNRG
jgi:hypothetical protein